MNAEKNMCSSRREFLKKTIKVTGYAIPVIMVFKMGSTKAWAQKYEAHGSQDVGSNQDGRSNDSCNGFFEKIFNTKCWW